MSDIVWFVLIGLATGLLTNTLLKGGRFGIIGDAIVGVLGAVLGTLLFRLTLDEAGGFWTLAVVAMGSAALLVLDLRLIPKSIAERLRPVFFWGRSPPAFRRHLGPRPLDAGSEPTCMCGPEQSEGTVPSIPQCSRGNLYRSF